MTTASAFRRPAHVRLALIPAALAAAFGGAAAQDAPSADEVRRDLYTLDNRLSVGLLGLSGEHRRAGQHRGFSDENRYGLVDLDLTQRDEDTGTWLRVAGRNLGLDTREGRFTHERQGDWAYTVSASQFVRREPLIVRSGLTGVGEPRQVVSATAPKRDLDLSLNRDQFSLGVRKFLFGRFEVQVSFSQEEQRGSRMYGRGTPSVMEFVTEPIDRVTRQWQVSGSYFDRRFQLSAGYGGSSYDNDMPVLTTTGGNNAANAFSPAWVMAMPPSNQAHQVFVSGGWSPSATTRASFKTSYQVATQNETFDPVFVKLAGSPDSLNGKLVTSLVFADVVTRPLPQLDLLASLRWEDRNDRTPEARFLPDTPATVGGSFGTSGTSGLYKPRSFEQLRGVFEAGWNFGGGYRALAAVEQENIDRSVSEKYRRMGMRRQNDERLVRVDLKRMGDDVFNVSLSVRRSERGGSDYLPDTNDPNALSNQLANVIWADRDRNQTRVTADWTPMDSLSFQLVAEDSRNRYSGRNLGVRLGDARTVGLDGSWRVTDKWTAAAWVSSDRTRTWQATRTDRTGAPAAGGNTLWSANLVLDTLAAGITVKGKAWRGIETGLDLGQSRDRMRHDLQAFGGTGTMPVVPLPEIEYRTLTAKLFADVPIDRLSGWRVELGTDRRRTNDWTWVNWVYNGAPSTAAAARTSDGTTVTALPRETLSWVGVTYRLRWR